MLKKRIVSALIAAAMTTSLFTSFALADGTAVTIATTDNEAVTVGNTLKATVSGMSGNVAYQWYADDVAIDGATEETFVPTYNQHKKAVKCVATVDGAEVSSEAVTVTSKFNESLKYANFAWKEVGANGTADLTGDTSWEFSMTNEHGKKLSFSLLDTFNNSDAKYYIMANDLYDSYKTPGTVAKYDPTEKDSMAYYVNNAFTQPTAWAWNLPKSIIKALDYDHVWVTEKANGGSAITSPYTYTAAVTVPAVWEMDTYKARIRFKIGGGNYNYLFRTPLDDTHYHVYNANQTVTRTEDGEKTVGIVHGNDGKWWYRLAPQAVGESTIGIRPEFFVNEDFFKTAKIDLATAGSSIIDEISKYSYQELSEIYTDEEITTYLKNVVITPAVEVSIATTDGKDATVGNTLKATIIGEATEIAYQWYADDVAIDGATEETFVPTYNQHKKAVKCVVTADGAKASSEAVTVTSKFNESLKYNNMVWKEVGEKGTADLTGDTSWEFSMTNEAGRKLSFSLLDTFNNTDAKYYIMANDLYDSYKTPGTVAKYDPTEKDSMAYYVNNAFTQPIAWSLNLPKSIIKALDYDHVWVTEKEYTGSKITSPYTYTAAVTVPAVWEMDTYKARIRFKIGSGSDSYLFRTPYNDTNYHVYNGSTTVTRTADGEKTVGIVHGNDGKWWYKLAPQGLGEKTIGIRPEFFVNENFFKTAKIDLATAGSAIIDEISKHSYQELSEIYTDTEISEYLKNVTIPAKVEVSVATTDGNAATVGNTLKATITGEATEIAYQWYADDVAIDGATKATFVPTYNQHKKAVKCVVTADGVKASSEVLTVTSKFNETLKYDNYAWREVGANGTADLTGDTSWEFSITNEAGTKQSFSLLDTFNNSDAKYYIMANNLYGSYKTPGTVAKYDPKEAGSMAEYVNTEFTKDTASEWNLPKAVIDTLDYDHVWVTEKEFTGSEITSSYTYVAGVTVPAIWEMEKYKARIRFKVGGGDYDYMFRTPYNDTAYHAYSGATTITRNEDGETTVGIVHGNDGKWWYKLKPKLLDESPMRIRPEFFVNEDFFKTARIDLKTAGSAIIDEISKHSYEDLSVIYTDAEIDKYLDVRVPKDIDVLVSWTDGTNALTSLEGATTIAADVVIDSRINKEVQTFIGAALYDGDKLVKVATEVVELEANEKGENVKLSLTGLSGITNNHVLKLFIWDNTTLKPICDVITADFSNIEEGMATTASLDMTTGEQVFYSDEPVIIDFSADGTFIMEIEDYYGSTVKSNLINPEENGHEYISLSCLDPGYYEVATYVMTDAERVVTDRTSFAVVENTEFIDNKDTSMFGINTHISAEFHRNIPELLADEVYKLGVKNVRDNYSWAKVSKEENVIDIPKTFITELDRLGIGAMMLGGFNNSIYETEDEKTPTTEKSINAFADYCKAVVDAFAENGNPLTEFEVWNEYWSWDESANSAQNYANLFNAVYNKLNPNYPNLKMAIGFNNTADGYNKWNDTVLKQANVKNNLGLATVHAYAGVNNSTNPGEHRPEVIGKIKDSMNQMKTTLNENGLSDMDISLTETGYSSFPIDVNGDTIYYEVKGALSKRYCVTEKEAGMLLPRCVLLGLANGAKDVYPYQLTDGSYDIETHESFFGLLRGDGTVCGLYSPKPQYVSYAAMIRALDGTTFDSVEQEGTKYCYVFKGSEKTVSAVYDSEGESAVIVSASEPFTVTDLMGKTVSYEAGTHTLDISGSVLYITGDVEIAL